MLAEVRAAVGTNTWYSCQYCILASSDKISSNKSVTKKPTTCAAVHGSGSTCHTLQCALNTLHTQKHAIKQYILVL
jgi:hypothetical protein